MSSSRTKFVLENFVIENFDAAGYLIGWQFRSDINLVFATDILDDVNEPTGMYKPYNFIIQTKSKKHPFIYHFRNSPRTDEV